MNKCINERWNFLIYTFVLSLSFDYLFFRATIEA